MTEIIAIPMKKYQILHGKDEEGEDEEGEGKDGDGEDEEEEGKEEEGEDEEEEGGWDPSIDRIDGSQIWFEDDKEKDYHEDRNVEGDDEETVLLDQNEEERGYK
jgi:hypothetical protein